MLLGVQSVVGHSRSVSFILVVVSIRSPSLGS
nr:MAG TPA: hypothetical protein [Caudoviricetes sp.]